MKGKLERKKEIMYKQEASRKAGRGKNRVRGRLGRAKDDVEREVEISGKKEELERKEKSRIVRKEKERKAEKTCK